MGELLKKLLHCKKWKTGTGAGRPSEGVMGELGSNEYPQEVNIRGYKPNTHVHIGQLKRAIKMLGKAKKPLFLVGGGVNIAVREKYLQRL